MIDDPDVGTVYMRVIMEIKRAEKLHPNYPADHLRRTAIMVEEAGEALKAAVTLTRQDSPASRYEFLVSDLVTELIHTTAMAFKQLIAMEKERGRID